MSDKNLRMQVVLSAVDKITRPFRNARDGSKELSAALKASKDSLKSLNEQAGRIDGFRKTRSQLAITEKNLATARQEAAELATQFAATNRPTAQQARVLEQAKNRASELQQTFNGLRLSVQRQREALNAAGIDTKQLSAAQRRLKTDAQATSGAIERQQGELRKLGERQQKLAAIRARHEKTTAMRNSLAGNGAGMVATGVTTGMTMLAPVRAYAESEDAATQLAASLMGPGAKVAPEFEKINRLAVSLGDKLPGTTADFQNMMTMLRRQGMSAQVILGGLGEATAYLGVQLKMAPTDAAEFAAKLQDATQTSEKDMMALTDIIQKGFYAGVDSENMLQGYAKIGSAMDIIKMKGLEAAKTFAPLLVMADQSSMAGEATGNAYRKVFQGMMDANKVAKTNAALKGTGVKFDFTNGKGEFGGIDKMYGQLAQLQKLSTQQRLTTLKTMFGDDAETLQVLNIMITKGVDGYRETAAKLENQASLRERVDASLNTLGNKWEAATGSFTNSMAAIGETVAPALKQLADWLGNLAGALGEFVKQHPQLTAGLFKLAAGFAIAATAVGALSLAAAAILGPMAMLRLSCGVLGIKAVSAFSLIRGAMGIVGNGVLWLGRLMMANPILAVIGLIAAGALYIWQHWDTLGPKFLALWEGIKNFTAAAWEGIKGAVSGAWEFIKSVFMNYTLPGLIYKNWDAIRAGIAGAWDSIKAAIAGKWEEIVDTAKALPERFQEAGSQMIDGLLAGISQKWEALKSKLSSLTDYLPDFLKPGGDKTAVPVVPGRSEKSATGFAGLYDSGGFIPSGQFGIVGENGPEIVNGPASITSRRRTASLAASAALAMGVAATPAAARPVHPMALPAKAQTAAAGAVGAGQSGPPIIMQGKYDIHVVQQPGQSTGDLLDELMRRLEEKERHAQARARSSYSDRGGFDS
ncbi:phage tail tape measure protein [Pantoea sp. AS-PWVM4]|uniref:phage tail tape measure protein n=1 Tax=Pantoea sp. AS-PWVM4 TaxID=1332069 RepID=UPI0003AC6261|nr:phage tail tape measure protein [Pantoea sp. AS-PWVM4]ERK12466.1 phage tail tape measure protein [Pantoea sp. AS-PWVM4]